MLRQRLKYALTNREYNVFCMQRSINVDGKVRSDIFFPAGIMSVVAIAKKLREGMPLIVML